MVFNLLNIYKILKSIIAQKKEPEGPLVVFLINVVY